MILRFQIEICRSQPLHGQLAMAKWKYRKIYKDNAPEEQIGVQHVTGISFYETVRF